MAKQPETIRVMIVDDHEVVRIGLRALLEFQGGVEVVGEAGNEAEVDLIVSYSNLLVLNHIWRQ